MTMPLHRRLALKSRAVINLTNATVLSRINGSTVVSGFPKTGTTYLSHVAQFATGRRYIEGSRRLAIAPSVIHCHFRDLPGSAVFSYRPIDRVVASYTTHLLHYDPRDLFERLATEQATAEDLDRIRHTAERILRGTQRMPGPLSYYTEVLEREGQIVAVEALSAPDSPMRDRLASFWGLSRAKLDAGIAEAEALSARRKQTGDEFYNRPSSRVHAVLAADADLHDMITQESRATHALLERSGHV